MTLFCEKCQTYLGPENSHCPQCGWTRDRFLRFPGRAEAVWPDPVRLPGRPSGRPVSAHGLIITAWKQGRYSGGISAFERDGSLRWQIQLQETPVDGLLVDGERLFFCTSGLLEGGSVFCCKINPHDSRGEVVWQQAMMPQIKGRVNGSPHLKDNRLYIPCKDGWVACLDSVTKEPVPGWSCHVERDPQWLISTNNALFVVCREGGHIFQLDSVRGGHDAPIVSIGAKITCEPLLWKNNLYVCLEDGRMLKVDLRHHAVSELARGLGKIVAVPVLMHDQILCGSQNHTIYALTETGIAWQVDAVSEHSISSSPALVGDVAVFGANDGRLYAVDTHNGEKLWQYDTGIGHGVMRDILHSDGVVYAGGYEAEAEAGCLYALPWHLGEYAMMAERAHRAGHFESAAGLSAVASFFSRLKDERDLLAHQAASAWLMGGKPYLAAAFWDHQKQFDQAAGYWKEAAELMRGRQNLRAAEYYYRASRLYWRLGKHEDEEGCAHRAAELANWPSLRITVRNNPIQKVGEAGSLTVRVENIGCFTAESLHFDVGGSLLQPLNFNLRDALAQEAHIDLSFLITPTRERDTVHVEVAYTAQGRDLPLSASADFEVQSKLVTKIKLGDMACGKVKIYNQGGREMEIEAGDMVKSELEIVMAAGKTDGEIS